VEQSDARHRAGRDALVAWLVVGVLAAVLVRVPLTLPMVGHVGSALISVMFLYAPIVYAHRRREDLDDYGFHAAPVGRGLRFAGVGMAIIFPLFVCGFVAFYEVACESSLLAHVVPPGTCIGFHGVAGIHLPHLIWSPLPEASFTKFCAMQWIVVALPEELFFRGFLLGLLETRFPPRRRWRGGGIGIALVVSSLAFALIHLPRTGDPRQLATFFPGLVFGWLASSRRSLLPSTVMHACCNVLIHVLDQAANR
jgi:membrane protease YdiL (CAAX protease family)